MPRPDSPPHHGTPDPTPRAAARLRAAVCLTVSLLAGAASADTHPTSPPPSLASLAAELGLTAADVESLAAGEAVVRPPAADEPREAAGLAYRVLPAAAERLSRAVADWNHYAEFFPFVLASEVVPTGDGATRVRQRVDLPFPFPDRHFTLRTSRRADPAAAGRPHHEVTWSLVAGSGNIAAQDGSWRIWALEAGGAGGTGGAESSLVELRLASDAGAGVPDGLERRALLETLAWALDGLRQQVQRCRYDLPIHPSCGETPPYPATGAAPPLNPSEESSP